MTETSTTNLGLVFFVLDDVGTMILEPVRLGSDLDQEILALDPETEYESQSLVWQSQDYNFDGQRDILLNQGPLGCYGDYQYRYFVSTPQGRYRPHPGLDQLADRHCHITPEPETGLILALDAREGIQGRYTWYRCLDSSCEWVRELVVEWETP